MVSPSKNSQQQPQQQVKKNGLNKIDKTTKNGAQASAASTVRIQKGPKPLEKKTFYLDIKNHALSLKLEAKIKELGGGIELFLVKNVSLVVTDRSDKTGGKWGYASGGSGGPPSLKSIEVPTPTPPTPYRSVEGPLSNSTNQRGQNSQRSKSRVDAMLERALTQPQQCSVDPLSNAISWGIPIWSTYELQSWLEKICASLKQNNTSKRDNRTASGKELKVKHLKEPYIKFESYHRESRPVFLELQSWPTLHFDGDPGSCPFDIKRKDKKEIPLKKEIKENREKISISNISKMGNLSLQGKDMTRRPRATATRARKTENIGYCEICRIDYRNLSKHLQSDQHLNFVRNDKNFISLDNLISTGASVEAFLKINRSKDVRKDCSLFASRDHSLDNGILSEDEKSEKRNKSNLNDYSIEEMKIMQYNSARRNLNLDSPHNLRTRAKHESGHLLRSKGRPWHEEEKSEKSFEKYIIKKRAKGTIWIEENDSEEENEGDRLEQESKKSNGENLIDNISMNGVVDPDCKRNSNKVTDRDNLFGDSLLEINSKMKLNGYERKGDRRKSCEIAEETKEINHIETKNEPIGVEERLLPQDNEDTNSLKSLDRGRGRPSKRGSRGSFRGRHRLSVEEKLLEDNKDYYKVEVLGNKLRSSAIPISNVVVSPSKEVEKLKKEENKPSSEKPVKMRFKRVRKSELSLLSDEAESFMFGDPRRDEEYETDGEGSSILPKDTESDRPDVGDSMVISSSPPVINSNLKQEDESQDSSAAGRSRKRRRTQTEALLEDNTDYYKFETPGSRLRYQAPLTGISEPIAEKDSTQQIQDLNSPNAESSTKVYPSKPSPEVEKMHFSFEAIPKSEPWYQTYQRQDEGEEYYYIVSESEKPFLLPYEIENFHEIIQKGIQNSGNRRKYRGRGGGVHVNLGNRPPRKSPRCHASTLAIMSTIIRRREQQQQQQEQHLELSLIEEETKPKPFSENNKKNSEKSDVDEDLKQIVENLDDMLSNNDDDSFEVDLMKTNDEELSEVVPPKGAPLNLLELLDNCHEVVNGIENSSCASSESGELGSEFPLKRRKKKRKNKTGWPGNNNRMRKRIHLKQLNDELQKEMNLMKKEEDIASHDEEETIGIEPIDEVEQDTGKENEEVLNVCKGRRKKIGKRSRESEHEVEQEESPKKLVFDDEMSSRTRRSISSEVESPVKRLENKEALSSISGDSEESNSLPTKQKLPRERNNTTSSEASNIEIEPRRFSSSPRKIQRPSEDTKSPKYRRTPCKIGPKKRTKRESATSDQFDDRLNSSEVDQRRSSIDYQPVVRVMKIDDNGVTIASNRRLRSSSSPRSTMQPPKKRFRHISQGKRQLIKNS